jgi:hypothetical protein
MDGRAVLLVVTSRAAVTAGAGTPIVVNQCFDPGVVPFWGEATLLLTVVPSALLHWAGLSRLPRLVVIGIFALVQILIHFRCLPHISFPHQRADLQLMPFSALRLAMPVS